MRDLTETRINDYRLVGPEIVRYFGSVGDATCGAFVVPSPIDRGELRILAAAGDGWDHVSVSRKNRCPNWTEMDHIKRMFFAPDEVVMQLHVEEANHINHHPYCLHLWRPHDQEIPLPPPIMVGPVKEEV